MALMKREKLGKLRQKRQKNNERMIDNMRLEGKSAVVTGASSGMGKCIVERFVREGACVVAVARRGERLEELAASLAGAPGRVIPFAGDISLQEVNEGAIARAAEAFGRLDVLVNNAGIMDDMSPIGDFTNEKMQQLYAVNVFGPMFAMRRAVQVFLEQGGGGSIINVASVGAMRSCAGAIYCGSKAALVAMTKNTAYMYQPQGIRCNAIAPGGFATEISSSMGMPNMAGYDRVKNVLATAPAPGDPAQIANAALYLASDEAAYVSGEVLVVDGGWIAG